MTPENVQAWVATIDGEARRYLRVLVPAAAGGNLRDVGVLPVFLSRWFGTTPDEAQQAIEAADAQGLIERDGDTYHATTPPSAG